MFRAAQSLPAIAAIITLVSAPWLHSQSVDDRIQSEHIRVRVPVEREWLGRDSVPDLERIWHFMNSATGGNLPRRILIVIDWNGRTTSTDYRYSSITVGMAQPAAAADMKNFLIHGSALGMARQGLYELSRGGTAREECEFLVEGMSEILVHEYERNSRSLSGAWIISQLLDKMGLLGLNVQTAWSSFSGGRTNLRSASPGITFLVTCRELRGRERLLKLFESLRNSNLVASLAAAFKSNANDIEAEWLKRVRSYPDTEEVTATSEEDAPRLLRCVSVPETGKAGASLELRLFVKDGTNDLFPSGIFLQDEASGKVLQAQTDAATVPYIAVTVPIEAGRQAGLYNYRITAVDESGNVRHWSGQYKVAS